MSNNNRALQVLSNLPPTPGRQVKYLKEELEKRDSENVSLKNNVTDLTKALTNLQLVTDKVGDMENTAAMGADDKSKAKKCKNKESDAPVAAKTAYRYFCEDHKDAGKDLEGNNDMRQLWKECQGDDRKKYTAPAAEDKIRFDKENTVYQQKLSEKAVEDEALRVYYAKQKQDLAMEFYEAHIHAQAAATNDKKKKKTKDPDAPKGAMTSYIFFCQEKREALVKKNSDMSFTDISKMLGEQWTKLKTTKKGTKKYDTMAENDKKRYEEEKKPYDALKADHNLTIEQERQTKLEQDKQEALTLMKEMQTRHDALMSQEELKKQVVTLVEETQNQSKITNNTATATTEKKKKVKDPNAPKGVISSYLFFCQDKREQLMKENPGMKPTEITKKLGEEWTKVKNTASGTAVYDKKAAADKLRHEQEKKAYILSKQV